MVKVKQVNVTANYAWSPSTLYPIQIATATAAQQLDASFSTTSSLSLYNVDLADPSQELTLAGQISIANRFYKVIWGNAGVESSDGDSRGLVVCGADNGLINIYDPKKLVESSDEEATLVSTNSKHTGPVKALDFNPFQKNLYASGASDSEIFIWDLKNPGSPMTPGKKNEPYTSISCIAWNRQVQHILGSSTSMTSGPSCYVWDLRKNASIIKVQDPSGRMQCSEIAWHPDVATQLVLASEDDRSPVVQLWDLRFANSPLRTMENHQRGVLSVAWCASDPDLLMTCGKDNRVICWNPNSTPPEVLYEAPSTAQWCFDVQWCPRNPGMISIGSFDGRISLHSLMGGTATYSEMPNKMQQDALTESFGSTAFAAAPVEQPKSPKKIVSLPLKKPPKWISKPCGATFSFGGKLVVFDNPKLTAQQQETPRKSVTIHQVVTETDFISRSEELRTALSANQFAEFCQNKMENSDTVMEEDVWSFMKAKFESEPRKQFLHLLGYDAHKIKAKIGKMVGPDELSEKVEDLAVSASSSDCSQSLDGSDAFEMIASGQSSASHLSSKSPASSPCRQPLVIPSSERDPESLISQALLVGDYESAVNLCLRENRMADAIVLAIAGGPQLLEKTQNAYFSRCTSKIGRLMLAVATKNWAEIVTACDLSNWKEALATLLTYSSNEEMTPLCDELGARLEADPSHKIHACLCYICSGNIDRFVCCWDSIEKSSTTPKSAPDALQELIEKVMILEKAVEGRPGFSLGQAAAIKLADYGNMLASQGKLDVAMDYLPASVDKPEIKMLGERLRFALGVQQQQTQVSHRHNQYVQQTCQGQSNYNHTGYSRPGQAAPINQAPATQTVNNPIPARTGSPSSNPYAANRRGTSKPSYAVPNVFTPKPMVPQQPSTIPTPGGIMNGYNQPMQPLAPGILQPTGPPTSQPPQIDVAYGSPARQPVNIPTDSPVINKGGWNDPPAVDPNRISKKKAPAPTFQPTNYNLMTPMQPAVTPSPMIPGMIPNQPPATNQPYVNRQNVPPGVPGSQMDLPSENQPATISAESDFATEPRQQAASMPTQVKEMPKTPIPAEHQILQTQFESLIQLCAANATNPQTKRKLEDCEKRMKFLYDKLRANTLSPHILSGLHQVAQSVGVKDYNSGLRTHTQIVSSSNFSEISAFMPGLKSVLQIAAQLRV